MDVVVNLRPKTDGSPPSTLNKPRGTEETKGLRLADFSDVLFLPDVLLGIIRTSVSTSNDLLPYLRPSPLIPTD